MLAEGEEMVVELSWAVTFIGHTIGKRYICIFDDMVVNKNNYHCNSTGIKKTA